MRVAVGLERGPNRSPRWCHRPPVREFEGTVSSVAAAICPDAHYHAIAAVVLFGPASRLTTKSAARVAPLVVQTADEIARRLRG